MIQGTEAMDRPVSGKRWLSRKNLLVGLLLIVPLLGGLYLLPSIARWLRSERSVELSRVRIGTVVRGDLLRDVSVQGRIVAAFHPTTFSPASGIVTLQVRAGEVVESEQILALVDSPELNSRLKQEQSTLQSLASDLDRQTILTRQAILANRQEVYEEAQRCTPGRWSGPIRDWSPMEEVRLNPQHQPAKKAEKSQAA